MREATQSAMRGKTCPTLVVTISALPDCSRL